MATINPWNNQVLAANIIFNGGTMAIGSDATDNAINIGTAANTGRTITIGNVTGTSPVNINTGTSGSLFTTTNGVFTLATGTGTISISADAAATTISIGTGAAVKGITLGSTNTTSSLALKSGSGNIISNNGLTIDSTGRNFNTVQPAFAAYLASSTGNNVTGDNTVYTIVFDTTTVNQGTNFNTSTGIFTAPVAGVYHFDAMAIQQNLGANTAEYVQITAAGSATQTKTWQINGTTIAFSGILPLLVSATFKLAANDTVKVNTAAFGSTKTVGVTGGQNNASYFHGFLVC